MPGIYIFKVSYTISYKSEGIFRLPLEEVEVSEQPSEEVLGEVVGCKEHMIVLGLAGRGSE